MCLGLVLERWQSFMFQVLKKIIIIRWFLLLLLFLTLCVWV